MASIGDLFFAFRGDSSSLVKDAESAGAKAGSGFTGPFIRSFDKLHQSPGFKAVTQGVGLGAGISAFNLLSRGIGAALGFMQDAAQAAKEDETNVAHLTAALKENVPGWKTTQASIDDVIQSSQRLAFTDDDVRDSLAALVPVTHNVGKAFAQQKVAMDLARFSHISLQEATLLLVKSDVGSTKALKALGIAVSSTSTAEERMIAIEKVAAGQAEAFANTQQGRADAEVVRLKEIQESFGREFVAPLQNGVMEMVVNSLHGLEDLNDGIQRAFGNMTTAEIKAHAAMEQTYSDFEDQRGVIAPLVEVTRNLGDAIAATGNRSRGLSGSLDDLAGSALNAASMFDTFYAAAEHKGQAAQAAKDLAAIKKAGPDSKSAQDIAIWKGQIAEATHRLMELNHEVAEEKGRGALLQWFKDQTKHLKETDKEGRDWLSTLRALDDLAGKLPPVVFKADTHTGGQGKAGGGVIRAGEGSWVGERGKEWVTAAQDVRVWAADSAVSRAAAAATSSTPSQSGAQVAGGNTYIVNVEGILPVRTAHDISDSLRRYADFGVLP